LREPTLSDPVPWRIGTRDFSLDAVTANGLPGGP